MNIDWAALSRLVPEALMVMIVLGFVWKTGSRQDAKDEKRDQRFLSAMAVQNKEWRDFMNVERVRQSEGLAQLTHEVYTLAQVVTATNNLITQHDAWERTVVEIRTKES